MIMWGQPSSSIPPKLHANISCPAILTKGFAINGNADEGVLIASSKYFSSNFCQVRLSCFPNSNLSISDFGWVTQWRRLRDTPRSSFFMQFFHGLQSHPPSSSGIPRRISLKRIASHLLPSGLMLDREPFFANVHLPRLSAFGVCILRSEVLLRCRVRRDFHYLHHLGQLPWCGAALISRCLPPS